MYKKFTIEGEISLNPYENGLFKLDDDITIVAELNMGGTQRYTVKKGFITDMGSIPRTVRRWFPYIGNQYLAACYLLHDALYATQHYLHSMSRELVDGLLYEMLKELPTGVSTWKSWCIYSAVDWFGESAWNEFIGADYKAIDGNQLVLDWRDK